jgi:hypothetical protein
MEDSSTKIEPKQKPVFNSQKSPTRVDPAASFYKAPINQPAGINMKDFVMTDSVTKEESKD